MPFPFPAAMLDRLAGLRTVGVLADQDELVLTAMLGPSTTRPDCRDLWWILGSRAWPCGWFYEVRVYGDPDAPGAFI